MAPLARIQCMAALVSSPPEKARPTFSPAGRFCRMFPMKYQDNVSTRWRRARASAPPRLAGRQVGLGDIGIEFDAIPRLVLNGEVAVLPERAFAHYQVRPPRYPVGQFVNAEFAHRRGGMAGRNRAHGAGGIVARRPDVVEI